MQPADGYLREIWAEREALRERCAERGMSAAALSRLPAAPRFERPLPPAVLAKRSEAAPPGVVEAASRPRKPVAGPTIPGRVVIDFYLKTLAERYERAGRLVLTFGDIAATHRGNHYVMPRHVCIWLMQRLCTQLTPSAVGRLLNIDPSAVRSARARASHWLIRDAVLREVAETVLSHFRSGGPA